MTVLLIPGLLCDAYCWEPLLARMDAAVADLSTQDSLPQMAEDLLAQYPGPLTIAGHSMGARVALEMAHRAPGRVAKLALLDTGVNPLAPGEIERRQEIMQFAYANGMEALAARWLPPMVWEGNQTNAALMEGLTAMVLRKDPDLHARHLTALMNRPNAQAYLPGIACPVLLVVGRQDRWSPVAQHQEMLALLPNARLEIVENAGHFAPVEQPEAVCDLLVPFLKE